MLSQVYVFTFLVTFLVHCFRWSPQPPFGAALGRSGGPLGRSFGNFGCHLERFGGVWGGLWAVFWCTSGNVKSCVFLYVFNGFQGLEGVRV